MTLIRKKTVYPLKESPIIEDYIIGTDSEDFGKTVSYSLASIADLTASLIYNSAPVENEYADISSMTSDQANQTSTFFQYVADATDDPEVDAGDAYYEKLDSSDGSLNDYRLLSDSEVEIILNSNGWSVLRVQSITDDTTLNTNVQGGRVRVEYDIADDLATSLLFNKRYSTAIENLVAQFPTNEVQFKAYNVRTRKYEIAKITSFVPEGANYTRAFIEKTININDLNVNDKLQAEMDIDAGSGGGGNTPVEEIVNPLDSYYGTRIKPTNSINGYIVQKDSNNAVGYFAENKNTGNGAYSGFTAKGEGTDDFDNLVTLQRFNSGYFKADYQNSGLLLSTSDLNIYAAKNTSNIKFRLGNTLTNELDESDEVLELNADRSIIAPSLTTSIIDAEVTGKVLITKEWVASSISGLEAIDEGNGIGWRLIGRDPAQFGNIGLNAVDFGTFVANTNQGATGISAFNIGDDNISAGKTSATIGDNLNVTGDYSILRGSNLTATDSPHADIGGINHIVEGGAHNFIRGINNAVPSGVNQLGYHILFGEDVTMPLTRPTASAFSLGNGNILDGYFPIAMGYNLDIGASMSNGAGTNFSFGEKNKHRAYYTSSFGVQHDITGSYTTAVGVASEVIVDNATGTVAGQNRTLFVVGNGSVNGNRDLISRSNAFQVFSGGVVLANSLSIAAIDAEATGKVLTTKEWINAQGFSTLAPSVKGQLLTYGVSPSLISLGSDGEVLTVNTATSTGLEWVAPSGGGSQTWQDTIIQGNTVTSTDTTVSLALSRNVNGLDFYMSDVSNPNNYFNFGIDDGAAPYFGIGGDDLDSNNGSIYFEIGGNLDFRSRSGTAIMSAESIYAAEGLKRSSQVFLDIDDAIISTNNPNTNQGGYLEIIGTSERVRLGHRNGSGIDNRFELQKPTTGNSSLIAPAINLPSGNDKYVPIYITDGGTTVEADSTGTVNISSLVGGGGGTISGTISDNQIAVGGTTTDDIEGSSDLTWGSNILGLNGDLTFGAEAGTELEGYSIELQPQAGWTGVSTTANLSARGLVFDIGTVGGWSRNFGTAEQGGIQRGGFGALGNNNTLTYLWFGEKYNLSGLKVGSNHNVSIGTGISPHGSYKLQVDGTILADTFLLNGGTNDDVLLGDGTTTSLAAIGGATNLTEGTSTTTTVDVNSDTGTNATLLAASTSRAGVMTKAKFDEVEVNNAKVSNIAHPLVETAVPVGALFTDTVYDDTTISAAVALNTAKETNATHTGDATGNEALSVVGLRGVSLDSTVGSPTDGKILVYRNAGGDWVLEDKPVPGGGGATQLNELSDVTNVTYTNRHVLIADGTDYDSRALVEADISDFGTYNNYVLPFADNSANWNTAFGWGDHAGLYMPVGQQLAQTKTLVAGEYFTSYDASTGLFTSEAVAAETPALTNTYIGVGNGSNELSGSAELTWNGTRLETEGSLWLNGGVVSPIITGLNPSNSAFALGAGSNFSWFEFDSNDSFVIRPQSRANLEAGTHSPLNSVQFEVKPDGRVSGTSTFEATGFIGTSKTADDIPVGDGSWISASGLQGVTDHTALTNIGTNTHAQIDTAIASFLSHQADLSIHFTQASISITESQISDLQSYLLTETDPVFTASQAFNIDAGDITNLSNLSGTNSGDQTTIAGITGTKAQFNTSLTDGTFLYVGDAPSAHTHVEADITDLGTYSTDIHGNIAALDLVSGTNSGDQTTIVGISGTKAQFNTSLSDGSFMFVGDAPTAHTHTLSAGATDVTATAGEVNLLDLGGLTTGWVLSADSANTASWKAPVASAVATTVTADTGSVINLGNNIGNYCNMSSANATTTYTTTGEVAGGFARVLINTTSEPTITGATSEQAADWVTGTNMYLDVYYDGTTVKYYFISIASAAGGGSGDVTKVGTPVNNQIGVWTGDGTLKGDPNFTWDGTAMSLVSAGNIRGLSVVNDTSFQQAAIGVKVQQSVDTVTGRGLVIGTTGEGYDRLVLYSNDRYGIGFGGGTVTRDVFINRTAVNTLNIDSDGAGGTAHLNVTGNINGVALTTGGSATNFLNEQGNYVAAGGGTGDVTKVGTPVNNQIGIWTGDGTLEGSPYLTMGADNHLVIGDPAVDDFTTELEGERIVLRNDYLSGGWARGFMELKNTADTLQFALGGYGSGQAFTYGWMGDAWNAPAYKSVGTFVTLAQSSSVTPTKPLIVGANLLQVEATGDVSVSGNLTATSFDSGGTAFQFVKGDGSLDSTAYIEDVTHGNSTFVSMSDTGSQTAPLLTASLSATGTPSATTVLRGDNTWASNVESKGISIIDPVATDDITIFYTSEAITITEINSHIVGGGTVVMNINHAATRDGTGIDVFTSDVSVSSTSGVSNNTGFNDATIPANSWVWLEVTSVTATPSLFHTTLNYTRD